MRFTCFSVLLTLMASCSSKSTTHVNSKDSIEVSSQDSIPEQSVDTVKIMETPRVSPPVPVAELKARAPNQKTLRCKFLNFEPGDCPHIIFDCADFGSALVTDLTTAQAEVWSNLITFEDHGDFPVPNPKYVGKTFEIVHNLAEGKSCDPAGNPIQVPNILSFKLISN